MSFNFTAMAVFLTDNATIEAIPDYNTTLNASVTTMEPYERPFGTIVVWVSGVLIYSFLIIGFTLNLLTVLVIAKFPQLRNIFVIFMLSLCISDLVSAIISPLFWYRRTLGFDHWALPVFVCKLFWAADIMTSFATALHIMAFGLLRYFSIRFPFWYLRVTKKIGKIFIVAIWIVSFVCGFVPFCIWFGARERDRYRDSGEARWPTCTINMEWYSQYTLFQKIAYPLFLYTPMVIVVLISVLTSTEVYANTKSIGARASIKRKRKDKQAVLQLVLIVISFLIGYLPFTVYEFWSVQDHEHTRYIKVLDYRLGLSGYLFIRFSECLNPIFYNLGSSRMRRYTRRYLRQLFGKEDKRRLSISVLSERV